MMKGNPEGEDDFEVNEVSSWYNLLEPFLIYKILYLNLLQEKVSYMHENISKKSSALRDSQKLNKSSRSRETILSQRNTITKICEEGKILYFWFLYVQVLFLFLFLFLLRI